MRIDYEAMLILVQGSSRTVCSLQEKTMSKFERRIRQVPTLMKQEIRSLTKARRQAQLNMN